VQEKARSTMKGEPRGSAACSPSGSEVSGRATRLISVVEVDLDRSARRRSARARGRKARSTAKGELHGRAACSESGIEVSGRAASSAA
jgi:hypothetical protein